MPDAIQEDVSEEIHEPQEETTEVVEEQVAEETAAEEILEGKPKLPREEAMNALIQEFEEQNYPKEEEPKETEPEEELKSPSIEDLGYYQRDGEVYTKLKINGEEREVRASQIHDMVQKELAGDQKLQIAAEQERILAERTRAIEERESRLAQSFTQPPDSGAEEEDVDEAIDAMFDGDTAPLKAILKARNAATPDIEQRVLQLVEQREAQRDQERAQQEYESSIERGMSALRSEHPEILDDPIAFGGVNELTARMQERAQQGDPEYQKMAPEEMIQKATDEYLGRKTPSKSTREENKRKLTRMPDTRTETQPVKEKEKVDHSPEAVIKRMRDARSVVPTNL